MKNQLENFGISWQVFKENQKSSKLVKKNTKAKFRNGVREYFCSVWTDFCSMSQAKFFRALVDVFSLLVFLLYFQKQSPGVKKRVYKKFTKFMGKHLCWSHFSIKLQTSGLTLLKSESGTCIFLWILRNFQERLFLKTAVVRFWFY